MMTAQELFDLFVRGIGLSNGQFISLIEVQPGDEQGQNWVLAAGNMPEDMRARCQMVLLEMRQQHPFIDWSDVSAPAGVRRRITGGKAAP